MEFKKWLNNAPENHNLVLLNDGSFNPVHRGHITITLSAQKFAEKLGYTVKKLVMLPKNDQWLMKKFPDPTSIIPWKHRLQMVQLAAQGTNIQVDDWEINSQTTHPDQYYKQYYEKLYPGTTLVSIYGEDYGHCSPLPCFETHNNCWYIRLPRTEDLSSTKIRKNVADKKPVDDYFPNHVASYFNKISI